MSAGAPFGPAYGLAVAAGQVPDAMLQGQNIYRQRQLEDMQRQQLAQELDRLRTQREIQSYSGDIPQSVSYQTAPNTSQTAPDTVTTAGGQTMPYTDWKSQLDATQNPSDDMIPVKSTYKPVTATRPLSEDEQRAAIFKNQASYALQRGRADLATSALEQSHSAEQQGMLMQARKAMNQLTTQNNLEGARDTLNQMGIFGTIAHIGINDAGDYVFTDQNGDQTPMSVDDMNSALYRMSTDPTIYSRWNAPAITRATGYVNAHQVMADSAVTRQQLRNEIMREGFQNTAQIAAGKNLTAIEVAKLRTAAQNFRSNIVAQGQAKMSDLQFMYHNAAQALQQQGIQPDFQTIMGMVSDQWGQRMGTVEYNKTSAQLQALMTAGNKGQGDGTGNPAPTPTANPTPQPRVVPPYGRPAVADQNHPPGPGAIWSPKKQAWFRKNQDGSYSPY